MCLCTANSGTGDLQPTEAAEEKGAQAEHGMYPHPFQPRRRMERHPQTASPPPRSMPPRTTMSVPHGAAPVDRKSQSARSPRKAQSPPPTTNAIESMMGKESSGMSHLQRCVAFPGMAVRKTSPQERLSTECGAGLSRNTSCSLSICHPSRCGNERPSLHRGVVKAPLCKLKVRQKTKGGRNQGIY